MAVNNPNDPDIDVDALMASFPKQKGLPIVACLPGSSAAAGGIRAGDVLIDVNGVAIDSAESYIAARKLDPDAMTVQVLRFGQVLTFTVQLASSTIPPINAPGNFLC